MPRLLPRLFSLPSRLVQRRARRSRMATLLTLACVLAFFFTPFYWIYKPPLFVINHLQRKWPDVLWRHPTAHKVVALTIDDSPSAHTNEIMQILRQYNVKATFFVIGNQIQGREAVLRDLVTDGHELGNHARYDEQSSALSDSTLVDQIHYVENMIQDAYLQASPPGDDTSRSPPLYFRPGAGWFSSRMRASLRGLGYKLVLGSIYPHDPQISSWRLNARHILSMLRPGGIIICHDRRSWTPPMLRKVLPEILKRGYRVVTVSELLQEPDDE